jgi:hypothetical protein
MFLFKFDCYKLTSRGRADQQPFRLSRLDELPRGTDIPHHLSTDLNDLHEICWSGKLGRGGMGLEVKKKGTRHSLGFPFVLYSFSFKFKFPGRTGVLKTYFFLPRRK